MLRVVSVSWLDLDRDTLATRKQVPYSGQMLHIYIRRREQWEATCILVWTMPRVKETHRLEWLFSYSTKKNLVPYQGRTTIKSSDSCSPHLNLSQSPGATKQHLWRLGSPVGWKTLMWTSAFLRLAFYSHKGNRSWSVFLPECWVLLSDTLPAIPIQMDPAKLLLTCKL